MGFIEKYEVCAKECAWAERPFCASCLGQHWQRSGAIGTTMGFRSKHKCAESFRGKHNVQKCQGNVLSRRLCVCERWARGSCHHFIQVNSLFSFESKHDSFGLEYIIANQKTVHPIANVCWLIFRGLRL